MVRTGEIPRFGGRSARSGASRSPGVPRSEWLSVAVGATALALGVLTTAEAHAELRHSTRYDAPAPCPAQERFDAELAARLRTTDSDVWQRFTFDVSLVKQGDEYVGSLFVVGPAQEVRRVLRDSDCTELVRAMAFVAAILVDPSAGAEPATAPEPEVSGEPAASAEGPLPGPVEPALRSPPADPGPVPPLQISGPGRESSVAPAPWIAARSTWTGRATAFLRFALTSRYLHSEGLALGPLIAFGARVGGELGAAISLNAFRMRSPIIETDHGSAQLIWTATAGELCFAYRPAAWLELHPCVGTEVGRLKASMHPKTASSLPFGLPRLVHWAPKGASSDRFGCMCGVASP